MDALRFRILALALIFLVALLPGVDEAAGASVEAFAPNRGHTVAVLPFRFAVGKGLGGRGSDTDPDEAVAVRLTDAFGLSATSQAAGMALTVDAAPPPPPEEVVAEAIAGQGVVVRWRVGAEASGVALYRSCPPGGELILMARITDGASFTDRSGLASAGSCSYQLATYDAHRNLSYPVVARWR